MLSVFTSRDWFVYKFFKHGESRCQKYSCRLISVQSSSTTFYLQRSVRKRQPRFPALFIPEKDAAAPMRATRGDVMAHVAMSFIIFSNSRTASAMSLANVSEGRKNESRPFANRAYSSLFMPSTYELMAYSMSSFCHCIVE